MFIAKNNQPVAKIKISQWNQDAVLSVLNERLMVNGLEASKICGFKPLETSLDIIFLSDEQITDGMWTQIATEFGQTVFPEITAINSETN